MLQQTATALLNISPCCLKVSCVPGICYITGMARIVHQQMNLAFGIAQADTTHIIEVFLIHSNDQVILLVIGPAHLARNLTFAADTVFGKLSPSWGIDRIANLLCGCRSR